MGQAASPRPGWSTSDRPGQPQTRDRRAPAGVGLRACIGPRWLRMVIAQAMACGMPVIATEATGIRELVTDGVEGIVVPAPPDAQTLAEAMDSLLSDTDRARAMGAAARRKVESLGGWDRYGRQLVAAFRDGRSGAR